MRTFKLLTVAFVLLVALLSAQPADACQRCGFQLVCVADECALVELRFAPPPNRWSYTECSLIFGTCIEGGGFCFWV